MQGSPSKIRVMVLAEMCNPTWASTPLIGYSFAKGLAEQADLEVTLITQIRNKPALQNHPAFQHIRVEYIDTEWIASPMYKIGRLLRAGQLGWTIDTATQWPGYVAFEKQIYQQFGKELANGQWEIIHRITPVTPVLPSYLPGKTTVPMIFGPTNGGLPYPKQFPGLARQEREWLTPFRGAYKYLPFSKRMFKHLSGLIVGSKSTGKDLAKMYRGPQFAMPENGVDLDRFQLQHQWPMPKQKFRFISVGRLVLFKGFHFLLEAFAGSSLLRDSELVLVGDGPIRQQLADRVQELKLTDRVHFRGWLAHEKLQEELQQAQVFAFPSIREFGGGVVLEAMACSLPCIVADYGGPAELVTEETGVRVPLAAEEPFICNIREAMEKLYVNPTLCQQMGEAASRRVESSFTWHAKAKQMVHFYRQILSGSSARQS